MFTPKHSTITINNSQGICVNLEATRVFKPSPALNNRFEGSARDCEPDPLGKLTINAHDSTSDRPLTPNP